MMMSKNDENLIGQHIDDYIVERALGAGGMGSVYLARDARLQRYVALKVMAPDFRADHEYTARFEREAQSIARLTHPNIVQIYRFGEVNDLYYMAMQYIDGADLDKVIADYRANGEVLGLLDSARIIHDIGGALDYAHSKGVIHRDVKAGNIILDKHGRASLTDFGLALLADSTTSTSVFGSPYYISPEQAASSTHVLPQSDLYSLGVVAFYMLTGRLPFVGSDVTQLVEQHISQPAPRPSDFNPQVPLPIDAVILRALEKNPEQRFPTGAAFADAFEAAVRRSQAAPEQLPESTEGLHLSQLRVPEKVESVRINIPALSEERRRPPAPAIDYRTAADTVVSSPAQSPYTPGQAPVDLDYWRRQAPAPPSAMARLSRYQLPLVVGMIGITLLVLCWGLWALLFAPPITSSRGSGTQINGVTLSATSPLIAIESATPDTLPTGFSPTMALIPTAPPLPTAFIPIAPTPITPLLPPFDRESIPPGGRRLGEFAVEWYCNERGLGVIVINNDSDWACTNGDGSTNFILQAADFDRICQRTYSISSAFAIRDQGKPTRAYNWSCYTY